MVALFWVIVKENLQSRATSVIGNKNIPYSDLRGEKHENSCLY